MSLQIYVNCSINAVINHMSIIRQYFNHGSKFLQT
uniref:Uncharacterized protein n=1 Tax=Rhizophora mucronata TaxID=61149 RepID=A0A2P2P804_RHIMU